MPARRSAKEVRPVRKRIAATDRPRTPTASELWDTFSRQLQQCVDDLGTDDILILSLKHAIQYVQMHHWGFAITLEAASNAYIDPPTALLDEKQYARAAALGWSPPTLTAEIVHELERLGESYEGSPNFFRAFALDEPGIVDLVVKTFRQVYEVDCPSSLQYKSFTADGASQIRWTGLSIKRELV